MYDFLDNKFFQCYLLYEFNIILLRIEGVKNEGIGIAIMDRLRNACSSILQ